MSEPAIRLPEQAGDVTTGDVAGGSVYKSVADIPPRLAELIADSREASTLMTKALDQLQDEIRLYQRMTSDRLNVIAGRTRTAEIALIAIVCAVILGSLILAALVWDRLAFVQMLAAWGR